MRRKNKCREISSDKLTHQLEDSNMAKKEKP